jgi:hypothetical protein
MAAEQFISSLKANPVSVACGALSLALALGIYFRNDMVPESETLLDQQASLGERINANILNGAELADQFASISASRQQIEARLIHPDELAKNLQFFYKLEADTGTKLIDLRQNQLPAGKPGAGGSKSPYIGVGYAVAVRGEYTRLLDFLRRLESGQRFCRIMTANITMSGSTEKDRGNELTLNLGLELLGQP